MNADYQFIFISLELILTKRSWRHVLLSECYQSKLVGLKIDEVHCVKSWREEFCLEFKRIGDLRSVVPKNVDVMALTATAAISSRLSIERTLGMKNPTVIEISPEKSNIYLFTELL
uniref:Helicase ATP-binding domain-containing protein n=1 Tax=Amphimedon queenslandica TaxID=400682 RepID=A0A1X7U8R5_AMPQE